MRMTWLRLVGVLFLVVGVAALSDEVGVRVRVQPDGHTSSQGWLALAETWGALELSGRAETDLVPVRLRSVSGSARLPWGWGAARTTVAHTGAGRTQLLTELEATTALPWDAAALSLSGGTQARASWAALGRSSTVGAWTVLRVEALPWWAEARADLTWPWAGVRWSGTAGVEEHVWVQLRVEGSDLRLESAGVEGGGEEGSWSASMFLGIFPRASQSVTVRWGGDTFRLLVRLSVRSESLWTAQTGASGTLGPLRWSGMVDLGREGWRSGALEVRWTL